MLTMQITLILAIIGYVSSAKLDHLQYLPPQGNSIQGSAPQQSFPGSGVKSGRQGGQYQPSEPFQQYGRQAQEPSGPPQRSVGPTEPQEPTDSQQYPQANIAQATNQYSTSIAPSAGAGPQQYPGQQYSGQQYPGPQYPEQRSPLADVPILRLDNENPGDGTYRYAYETGNGIAAQEEGSALSGWNKAQGSYHFTSPEGQTFEITYTADENGYVPQGAHLPTPPPIPEAILKSLEVIRQAEAQGGYREGQYEPEGDEGQYHESHDEGQYNHQQPSGGYQQGGVEISKNIPQGQGAPQGFSNQNGGQQQYQGQQRGVEISSNVPQGQGAPQGFSNQNGGQQQYQRQQGGQQQPVAPNGGYQY